LTKEIVGKSDEQLQKIAAENPSSLSVEELLYTATLNPNLNYKKSIYQKVVELYPEDVRTYNNLGVVEYQLGNIDAAHSNFTKALAKDKNNALANMNMGSILLAKGNIKEAQTYLGNAGGAGNELNLLNGAVAIANGDYKKAVAQYGNSNTNNAALAYILNNDYSKARNILENISTPNAKTYYLQSIVAARTNDAKALVQAVTNTINADNSYKERFLTNPEFTAFLSNAAFSQIFK
jgi:Flp pilus assembly protein TadD